VSEILAWRLCATHRLPSAFSGEGAARRGGRWNHPGVRIVYCAESRSLAALEVLVHADETSRLGAIAWVCLPAVIPEALVEKPAKVPASWRHYPHGVETQEFGTQWAHAKRSVALRVPSAVVCGEFNFLLNPLHPDFERVIIGEPEPFTFDPRIGPAGR
jgi:RES domain-containing protein